MRKIYLLVIELYWWLEHIRYEPIACFGYRSRKKWENKYVNRFDENIYGQPFREEK